MMNMNDRFKDTFDRIHADDGLKEHTREFLGERLRNPEKKMTAGYRHLAAAMFCFLILAAGLVGGKLYMTETTVISIDVNPSLELGINRFDRVIWARGMNPDGEILVSSLDLRFRNYEAALEEILSSEPVADCLARDEILSIAVVGDDERQCRRLLSGAESCTAGEKNAYCCSTRPEEVEKAHEEGLSYGKYRAFLEAGERNPDLEPEDARGMTMRELHDLIHGENCGEEDGHSHGRGGKKNRGQS